MLRTIASVLASATSHLSSVLNEVSTLLDGWSEEDARLHDLKEHVDAVVTRLSERIDGQQKTLVRLDKSSTEHQQTINSMSSFMDKTMPGLNRAHDRLAEHDTRLDTIVRRVAQLYSFVPPGPDRDTPEVPWNPVPHDPGTCDTCDAHNTHPVARVPYVRANHIRTTSIPPALGQCRVNPRDGSIIRIDGASDHNTFALTNIIGPPLIARGVSGDQVMADYPYVLSAKVVRDSGGPIH